MKIWFTDTSVLIKRYIREAGCDWLRAEVGMVRVVVAPVTPVEMTAALGRRYRLGLLSQFAFYQARNAFLHHLNTGKYHLVDWQKTIADEAMRLTFHRMLRAYDAVQLASALIYSTGLDRMSPFSPPTTNWNVPHKQKACSPIIRYATEARYAGANSYRNNSSTARRHPGTAGSASASSPRR